MKVTITDDQRSFASSFVDTRERKHTNLLDAEPDGVKADVRETIKPWWVPEIYESVLGPCPGLFRHAHINPTLTSQGGHVVQNVPGCPELGKG